MDASGFMDWLKAQRGVRRAEEMPPELLDRVEAEESTIMSAFGTPVDNSGLRDCLSRGRVFLAFVESGFWVPPTTTMILRDSEGGEIGRDIPYSAIPEYAGRSDLIFISDNFVMYADRGMGDAPYMEMLSQDYRGEDGSIPESCSAVLWFPSPSSSGIIHAAFGQPDEGMATAMIGINLRAGDD